MHIAFSNKMAGAELWHDETIYKLEIRSMEQSICPIAVLYFAVIRSVFNI